MGRSDRIASFYVPLPPQFTFQPTAEKSHFSAARLTRDSDNDRMVNVTLVLTCSRSTFILLYAASTQPPFQSRVLCRVPTDITSETSKMRSNPGQYHWRFYPLDTTISCDEHARPPIHPSGRHSTFVSAETLLRPVPAQLLSKSYPPPATIPTTKRPVTTVGSPCGYVRPSLGVPYRMSFG